MVRTALWPPPVHCDVTAQRSIFCRNFDPALPSSPGQVCRGSSWWPDRRGARRSKPPRNWCNRQSARTSIREMAEPGLTPVIGRNSPSTTFMPVGGLECSPYLSTLCIPDSDSMSVWNGAAAAPVTGRLIRKPPLAEKRRRFGGRPGMISGVWTARILVIIPVGRAILLRSPGMCPVYLGYKEGVSGTSG